MKSDNRGSEWRKWDLHIHSPKTFLSNEYGGCSDNAFIRKIKKSGLACIGLTNYFKFEDGFWELKKKLESEDIVVFPNLEFRTEQKNKDGEEIHIHILFSNTISCKKVSNFLNRLETIDRKYCEQLEGNAFKKTVVGSDKLKEAVYNDKDIEYLRDFLIISSPRGQGGFRPPSPTKEDGRGRTVAISIDEFSDAFFGKSADTDFYLSNNKKRYEGSKPKPVFSCSDAHKLDSIGETFSWVKADCTFEGLKQTLYSPKERVFIQDRKPSDSKAERLMISHVTYKTCDGREKKVSFSKDLNSIIGVRGSGKSTLIKNLAKKIDQDEFNKYDEKSIYDLKEFKVFWFDTKTDSGEEESIKNIFYIPQGYLSSLAYDGGDEKEKKRDDFLTSLLKKSHTFSNAIQSFENFALENKTSIEKLIQRLILIHNSIKESRVSLKKQGSESEIKLEIENKGEEVKKYTNEGITKEEIDKYSNAKSFLDITEKNIGILSQDKEILQKINELNDINISINNQEFNQLSAERQEVIRCQFHKKSKEELKELMKDQIKQLDENISKKECEKKEKMEIVKKLKEKIKMKEVLEGITKEIIDLSKTLDNVRKLSKKIECLEKEKKNTINNLAKEYGNFKTCQEEIYKSISFKEDFSFLKIDIVIRFNIQQIKDFVENYINTRDTDSDVKENEDIKIFFGNSPNELSENFVKELIGYLLEERIKLKKSVFNGVNEALTHLLKNPFEIDYLNSVKTKKELIHFKKMTGGQRAIALLELCFRFDKEKYPILIDQPEDDLDVRGISTDLANFIINEKQNRQVIIVSHNANLVVCADTENIIVSDLKIKSAGSYNFSYETGSIESPERRMNIIDILEGGEDALEKRMLKLGINRERLR